jgi:DNA-directed RNA polymerase specialized sigma24 family protein
VCTAASSHPDLDSLLRGFLAGDPVARQTLPRAAERYVLMIARRFAADLADDIHYEVMNQAFENLTHQKATAYCPTRGSAGTFLKLMVRAAARQVRATYARPGHVTRVRRSNKLDAHARGQVVIICLHDLDEAELPSVEGSVAAVEAKQDVENLLRLVTPSVADSLRRLHMEGQSMQEVAASAGVSRFKMSRQITESLKELQAAA